MRNTFNKAALAFALVLGCIAGAENAVAESFKYIESQPMVLARGSAHALGRLGFRYENGFGVPQNYIAAADLYRRGAERGDAFAQSRLGLSYDKGHGVPQDFILSYKWLDLAAARGTRRERDFYLRLRDAIASKMSLEQVTEGQRLALIWAANWESGRR